VSILGAGGGGGGGCCLGGGGRGGGVGRGVSWARTKIPWFDTPQPPPRPQPGFLLPGAIRGHGTRNHGNSRKGNAGLRAKGTPLATGSGKAGAGKRRKIIKREERSNPGPGPCAQAPRGLFE